MNNFSEAIERMIFSRGFRIAETVVLVAVAVYVLYRLLRFLRWLQIKALRYGRGFSDPQAYRGDTVTLTETICNRTVFPVFLVEVEGWITRGLGIDGCNLDAVEPMQKFVSRFDVILPFTEITRTHEIFCARRGHYFLESVEIAGDGKKRLIPSPAELYVYPEAVRTSACETVQTNLYGERGVRRALIADRFSVCGIRDYRKGDPFGAINFKATAKYGFSSDAIKVNNYDYTQNINCAVFINFNLSRISGVGYEKYTEMMEYGLSVASGIVRDTTDIGGRIALFANCSIPDGGKYLIFPSGGGEIQFDSIMRALAEIKPGDGYSFSALVDMFLRSCAENTQIIIISPPTDEAERERVDMIGRLFGAAELITLHADWGMTK